MIAGQECSIGRDFVVFGRDASVARSAASPCCQAVTLRETSWSLDGDFEHGECLFDELENPDPDTLCSAKSWALRCILLGRYSVLRPYALLTIPTRLADFDHPGVRNLIQRYFRETL